MFAIDGALGSTFPTAITHPDGDAVRTVRVGACSIQSSATSETRYTFVVIEARYPGLHWVRFR